MTPTRRAVVVGGAGLVAVGLGLGALAVRPGVRRAPRRPLVFLDPAGFSVLAAIADRVCPGGQGAGGGPHLPSAWELEVPEALDLALDAMNPATAAELASVLGAIESAVVGLADGRIRPFTAADGPAQDRALLAWRDSRITLRRSAFKGVVALVSAAYWANPATWAHVGYPGPPRFPAPSSAPGPAAPTDPSTPSTPSTPSGETEPSTPSPSSEPSTAPSGGTP
ncbi:MAG: gluconate 2-dehydrogenase subunit 3 family protein [Myxococcota bacterium]